ncbi:MAG: hypothetical protein F4066_01035 [Chloroflexi bacterium]|nr:hypothetical protein [Chloroflexota bacterium]MYF80331.1 hypothetical protein [Chloroflexota bacterium]MYI03433.1 hypothetical protein [Chloroflexota bacterium]
MSRQPRRTRRHGLSNYRSSDPAAGAWWQRGADFTGMHSILAFVVAIALVAVVGVAFDPLGVTTEFDLPDKEMAAFNAAYEAAYEEGQRRGVELGRQRHLILLGLEHKDGDAAWVRGIREGWTDGWNAALDAMLRATESEAPADELQRERDLLLGIDRR